MRLNLFASALAFSATAYAAALPVQLTPAQIVTTLQGLTSKATAVRSVVDSIGAGSATQFLTGGGPIPAVIAGIQDIAANAQGFAAILQAAQAIPAGTSANNVIAAYQEFAQVQQSVLNSLNSKLAQFPVAATVAAPLTAILQNLQVALNNLATQLTARLGSQAPTVSNPTNALTSLLEQVISTVTGLLNGLNLQDLLGGLLGGLGGATGGATGGSSGSTTIGLLGLPPLPPLPFNLSIINSLVGNGNGLKLGTLPVVGQLLSGLTGGLTGGGSGGLLGGLLGGGVGGLLSGLTGGLSGGSGGILAKRVEAY